MGTYNLGFLTKKLLDSKFSLVSLETLKNILGIENERTLHRVINDFIKNGILVKLEKGKYEVTSNSPDTFEIANFLYQPSYISLETALNYWGILSQFPFEVSSVTPKKTVKKIIEGKIYTYSHITSKYFGMLVKKNGSLIASPEKALFDQFYLVSKGIRVANFDEYDFDNVNKKKFLKMCYQLKAGKNMMDLVKNFVK